MTSEVYFSPRWNEREQYLPEFRAELTRIWKNPPFLIEVRGQLLSLAKKVFVILRKWILKR